MTMPALFAPVPQQFFNDDGTPIAGGLISTVIAGLSTPKATYTTAALVTPNTNPIVLDSAGRANIFLATGAYDFIITKADLTPVRTVSGIEDITNTWLPLIGTTFGAGARAVSPNYTFLSTDNTITVNSSSAGSSAAVINLPAANAVTSGYPKGIVNIGTSQVAITPAGSDTINTLSAGTPLIIPAGTATSFPSAWLLSNGTSNWIAIFATVPSNPVTSVTAGLKMNVGHVTLDGTNPTLFPHGLTTCTDAQVSIKSATISGSGLGLSLVTYVVNGANVEIYAWRPNNSGDTTLVASGDNTTVISVTAYGS